MLLPSFAILTLVLGIKTISDGVVIQQGSRRQSRAIDFRKIQGMVSVNGIGMFLSGLAGTLPPMSNSSYSYSLINLTGVAARRVGIGVAVVTVALAFFSKFTAILLSIPGACDGRFPDARHGHPLRERYSDGIARRHRLPAHGGGRARQRAGPRSSRASGHA